MDGAAHPDLLQSQALSPAQASHPPAGACMRDLGAVLARFARTVKATVRSHNLGRHGIDEDDVEQEIRIRLWTALARDPEKDLPGAYVQKVVFSAVIDAVRRERVRRRDLHPDFDLSDDACPDLGRQPDALVAQRQWAEHLHRCIQYLQPRRRRPVQLFLLGYTLQEVSDANRVTLDSGSKLVRRGLAELRCLLQDHRQP